MEDLPSEIWAATPGAAQARIVAQRERVRDMEARLEQGSAHSSGLPRLIPVCPFTPGRVEQQADEPTRGRSSRPSAR